MSAATRLETALLEACEALMEVVGLAENPADSYGPRTAVNGVLVDRDEVPLSAWRAAVFALDVLSIGYGVMDPEAESVVSVEEGLAAMTRERP